MQISANKPQAASTRVAGSNKKLSNNKPKNQKPSQLPKLDKAKISEEAKKLSKGVDPSQIKGLAESFGSEKPYSPHGTGEGLGKPQPPLSKEPIGEFPKDPSDPYGTGDGLPKGGGSNPFQGIQLPTKPSWEFRPGYNPAGTGGL